jgi:hypothetical protein
MIDKSYRRDRSKRGRQSPKSFGRAPDTKPEAEGAIGWLGGRGSHRPL